MAVWAGSDEDGGGGGGFRVARKWSVAAVCRKRISKASWRPRRWLRARYDPLNTYGCTSRIHILCRDLRIMRGFGLTASTGREGQAGSRLVCLCLYRSNGSSMYIRGMRSRRHEEESRYLRIKSPPYHLVGLMGKQID